MVGPPLQRLLLVRHAECEMNLRLDSHIGGQSNGSPLTPLGADALASRLARLPEPPASLHASTAVRAVGTAAAVAAALGRGAGAVSLSPDLLELNMGAWEGALRAECYTPAALDAIHADPAGWAPPSGESQAAVEARVAGYIVESVLPAVEPGGPPALVVGHGLAIKCFLRRVLACEPHAFAARNLRLDNTSITEVGYDAAAAAAGRPRDAWHVLRVNDAAHAEGL